MCHASSPSSPPQKLIASATATRCSCRIRSIDRNWHLYSYKTTIRLIINTSYRQNHDSSWGTLSVRRTVLRTSTSSTVRRLAATAREVYTTQTYSTLCARTVPLMVCIVVSNGTEPSALKMWKLYTRMWKLYTRMWKLLHRMEYSCTAVLVHAAVRYY